MEEFKKASCIWCFHVYQDNWTPILGERLVCKYEPGNARDRYAVAVYKTGDEIVGHLPRNISTMCWIFIRCGGIIYCTVSGRWQYSRDLPQGGMETQKNYWKSFAIGANLRKPWTFSTSNDLHYTVYVHHWNSLTCSFLSICDWNS